MKSYFLKAVSSLFLVFATVGLVACGDDDGDDGGGGSSSGSSKVPAPYLVDSNGNKIQVSSVYNTSFTYDSDGKLTGLIYNDRTYTIGSTFTLSYSDEKRSYKCSILTNSDGLITQLSYTKTKTDGESETQTENFQYNSNRQLTKVNMSGTFVEENEKGSFSGNMAFTWSNGNLMSYTYNYNESYTNKKGEKKSDTENKTYTFEYGNQVNSFKQLPTTVWEHAIDISGIESLGALGLLGVGPVNLPTGYTKTDGEYTNSYTLSYILNNDGSINKENDYITYIYK